MKVSDENLKKKFRRKSQTKISDESLRRKFQTKISDKNLRRKSQAKIPDTQLVCNEGKTGKELKHEIRFSFLNTPSIPVMLVAASER